MNQTTRSYFVNQQQKVITSSGKYREIAFQISLWAKPEREFPNLIDPNGTPRETRSSGNTHNELGKFIGLAIHLEMAIVLTHNDFITQR